jgi:prepilin-type N-terminal cleavage/methylation domain-containing protein
MSSNNKHVESTRRPAAFTLIELLVVIAIIALLVSVLMPALQNAKELARGAVCMNQLRNIGNAFHYYREDFNDKMYHGNQGWTTPLSESGHLTDPSQIQCPSQEGDAWDAYFHQNGKLLPYTIKAGYGVNHYSFYCFTMNWSYDRYTRQHEAIMFFDCNIYGIAASKWTTDPTYLDAHFLRRHHGFSNVAYLDAHVGKLTLDEILDSDPYAGH